MEQKLNMTTEITITILWISTVFLILWGMIFASSVYAQRSYQQTNKTSGFIERLDQDSDGKVSQDEFDGPADHFSKMDTDSDGYIDDSEQPKGPPCGKGNGSKGNPITRFDKDGDNKLSQEEFPGPDNHFTMFDKDGDGYLGESEMPKGPPGGKGKRGSDQGGPMRSENEE